jgi:hypothetical protein
MKRALFSFLLTLLVSFTATSQNTTQFFKAADSFFKTYTQNGSVAYKEIASNNKELTVIMDLAKEVTLSAADVNTIQSFWINAYNISVIQGIVSNYPIKSPLDKKGFFDKTTYTLAGEKITLNDIENKKLRAAFGDARFHFVLVCGAKGCPPIIAEAYMPTKLDSQLERQTKKALNNNNFIKVSKNKVAFSEIFKWYKEDFVTNGNELQFLNIYRTDKVSEDAKITYYSYDWRLNSK